MCHFPFISLFFISTAYCALLTSAKAVSRFEPEPQGCGKYQILGKISLVDKEPKLVVHSGTRSETQLRITPASEQLRALAYKDETVEVTGQVRSAIRTYRGSIEINAIHDRVPNPLNPAMDNGFQMIKAKKCD